MPATGALVINIHMKEGAVRLVIENKCALKTETIASATVA